MILKTLDQRQLAQISVPKSGAVRVDLDPSIPRPVDKDTPSQSLNLAPLNVPSIKNEIALEQLSFGKRQELVFILLTKRLVDQRGG